MTAQASAPARLARPLTVEEYQRISHAHRLTVAQNLVNAQHAAEAQATAITKVRAEAQRKLAAAEAKVAAELAERTERLAEMRSRLAAVNVDLAQAEDADTLARKDMERKYDNARRRLQQERRHLRERTAASEERTRHLRGQLALALEDEQRVEGAYREACARIKLHWRKLQGRNLRLGRGALPEVKLPADVAHRLQVFERELDAFHRGRSKAS